MDTGAAFEQANIETCQLDQLFAVFVLTTVADGGQESNGRGGADPGQLYEELEVRTLHQEFDGFVEPHLLFAQGVGEVMGQGFDLKGIDTVGVFEAEISKRVSMK